MVYRAVYHGLPWYATVYHGNTVVRPCRNTSLWYQSLPWFTMVNRGTPYTIVYHAMVYYGAMLYRALPWYTTRYIPHGIPW